MNKPKVIITNSESLARYERSLDPSLLKHLSRIPFAESLSRANLEKGILERRVHFAQKLNECGCFVDVRTFTPNLSENQLCVSRVIRYYPNGDTTVGDPLLSIRGHDMLLEYTWRNGGLSLNNGPETPYFLEEANAVWNEYGSVLLEDERFSAVDEGICEFVYEFAK